MASRESDDSFREVFPELERLVEVWKNLRRSYMNFEPITDLITQKLVGLGAIGDNELHGSSLKDLSRLVDIRNTIVELNICSMRHYGEHWQILDAFLKKMITMNSAIPPMDPEYKSDLDCLEILEEWATLASKMIKYPVASPESVSLVDHVIVLELNNLWKAFEKGIVVKDDVNSMKALEIAARLRDTLRSQFHMWMDKIIAQKLRILSIRQAGKSDPSLNGVVQCVQKPSAMPEEQDNVHQDSNKQDIGFSNGESEAAVNNVEMGNLELNEQDLSTVAWVHDYDRESSHHSPPGLDWRTLDVPIASLSSRVTTGENELKQAKETSDRSIEDLEAEKPDLVSHIEILEEGFRKEEALVVTLKTGKASPEIEISDVKEDYAKIKGELRQMTEAYEDRTAHAISLSNELVQERLSQFTKAVKINELKEEKEALIKELQEAKTIIDRMKQWSGNRLDEGVVKVEDGKSDQDDVVSYVPPRLGYEYLRSTGTVDNALPKRREGDNDGSSSSVGEVTPTSSNGSVQLTNKRWDAYMAGESGFLI